MLEIIREANDLECLVVSGSLSPEMDSKPTTSFIDVVKTKGSEFVLDISDTHLADLVEEASAHQAQRRGGRRDLRRGRGGRARDRACPP